MLVTIQNSSIVLRFMYLGKKNKESAQDSHNKKCRVIFLDSAKIVEEGTPEEVFGNPKNERTKIFFSKILH